MNTISKKYFLLVLNTLDILEFKTFKLKWEYTGVFGLGLYLMQNYALYRRRHFCQLPCLICMKSQDEIMTSLAEIHQSGAHEVV